MIYPSKRDALLLRKLRTIERWFLLVGTFLTAGSMWLAPKDVILVLGVAFLCLTLGVRWIMRSTLYEITATHLRIRSGPSRLCLPLHNIESITPSRERHNAPALSWERLRIDYSRGRRRKHVLISPQDTTTFLRELGEVEPNLAPISSGGLRRTTSRLPDHKVQ